MASEVHTLLVPWSGLGHIVPMLQLAQFLVSSGIHVTVVYASKTHAHLSRSIHFQSLHEQMGVEVISDGLSTAAPSREERAKSMEVMKKGVEEVIQRFMDRGNPVTHLISSTFVPWTHPLSQQFCIPRVELWSSLASIYSIGFHAPLLASHGFIPFAGSRHETWITCIPGVPPMRASDYPPEFLSATPEFLSVITDFFGHGKEAQRVLVNSIYEVESEAFDSLKAHHIPVSSIGPLFLHTLDSPHASLYPEDHTCLEWLQTHPPSSVVYIAFGSASHMSEKHLLELALGIEASQQPFLWVIRPDSVNLEQGSDCESLFEDFKQRSGHQGLIISWAPQSQVLSHASVAAFLNHCGWNSIMESIWAGVPLIAWPQRADQGFNKKMIVEDWKVGIELESGEACRGKVEKAVREMMEGEAGKEARNNVLEMRELMKASIQDNGSSKQNLIDFIQELKQTTNQISS